MVEPAESVPQQGRIQSVSSTRDIKSKEVYVKKWVDYSNKYGLGYILTNGETGVYFNDSTKLTLSANKQTLRYIEKKMDRTENISTFKVTELPSSREITKKYTLLTHFRTYLESDEPIEHVDSKSDSTGTIFYVKKWMKTKYAILFRLSNKIVQVNFTDKTELLLSSEHKQVTYVNRTGVRKDYHLVAAMESDNHEMTKRLKYTRELLTHMLNGSNPNHEKEPVPQQEPL
jgi:polo-like kinase 1